MIIRIALCLTALLVASPAFSQTRGKLTLPEFASLSDKASEVITVTLDPNLLGIATRFLDSADPDQAKVQKLVQSLTGIYVRSYTFDHDFAYPKADIDRLRQQLKAPGWSPMVEVHSNKEKANVDVFMHVDDGRVHGLAIIASEPREFTIVNIVGNIDLEQLHDLEGSFGVPKLDIEKSEKPAPKKK